MFLIKFIARLNQIVIHHIQVLDGRFQMLMPKRLADHLQPPPGFPTHVGKIPSQHVRCDFNLRFLFHPIQHFINAVHLQGLSYAVPHDVNEQECLVLQ